TRWRCRSASRRRKSDTCRTKSRYALTCSKLDRTNCFVFADRVDQGLAGADPQRGFQDTAGLAAPTRGTQFHPHLHCMTCLPLQLYGPSTQLPATQQLWLALKPYRKACSKSTQQCPKQ